MWPLATCISSTCWTPRLTSLMFFLYTVIAYSHSRVISLTSKFNDLSSEDWEQHLSLLAQDLPWLTLLTYVRSKASCLNTAAQVESAIVFCFLDNQDMTLLPSIKQYPAMEHQPSAPGLSRPSHSGSYVAEGCLHYISVKAWWAFSQSMSWRGIPWSLDGGKTLRNLS